LASGRVWGPMDPKTLPEARILPVMCCTQGRHVTRRGTGAHEEKQRAAGLRGAGAVGRRCGRGAAGGALRAGQASGGPTPLPDSSISMMRK
jgi:hypothetical protein